MGTEDITTSRWAAAAIGAVLSFLAFAFDAHRRHNEARVPAKEYLRSSFLLECLLWFAIWTVVFGSASVALGACIPGWLISGQDRGAVFAAHLVVAFVLPAAYHGVASAVADEGGKSGWRSLLPGGLRLFQERTTLLMRDRISHALGSVAHDMETGPDAPAIDRLYEMNLELIVKDRAASDPASQPRLGTLRFVKQRTTQLRYLLMLLGTKECREQLARTQRDRAAALQGDAAAQASLPLPNWPVQNGHGDNRRAATADRRKVGKGPPAGELRKLPHGRRCLDNPDTLLGLTDVPEKPR